MSFDVSKLKADLERSVLEAAKRQLRQRFNGIRHPETGEFPTVSIRGNSLQTLVVAIEGSRELIGFIRDRLQPDGFGEVEMSERDGDPRPRVFLSYNSGDRTIAQQVAEKLTSNGLQVWWDQWEIRAGDSIRRKIDEGLLDFTHFIVLLTANSVDKPWVNQEIDAALVAKLNKGRSLIPLRHNLSSDLLPPLLSGIYSPEIVDFERDILQLTNDIYGITRRPPVGKVPVTAQLPRSTYSPAAMAVAKFFCVRAEIGCFGELQFNEDTLAQETGLTIDDVKDALHELKGFVRTGLDRFLPEEDLFASFDMYFMGWNPEEDALRLASDMISQVDFPRTPKEIDGLYGWGPRRLNSAIAYLRSREIIRALGALGTKPWIAFQIDKTEDTRRFVRSRRK